MFQRAYGEDDYHHWSGLLADAARALEVADSEGSQLTSALRRLQEEHEKGGWQPIETAPKDGTLIIGALIDTQYGRVCRVHDMKHNGLAFYTVTGHSLPQMTHWMPIPALLLPPAQETRKAVVARCESVCILNCDSPSIPPTDDERIQCGCSRCLDDVERECGDVTMDDSTRGLYNKFKVTRTDGSSAPGGKHEGCEYFVLDLDHDPYARVALHAYATGCSEKFPALSRDLTEMAMTKRFGK